MGVEHHYREKNAVYDAAVIGNPGQRKDSLPVTG
jgi:hypothetical protein